MIAWRQSSLEGRYRFIRRSAIAGGLAVASGYGRSARVETPAGTAGGKAGLKVWFDKYDPPVGRDSRNPTPKQVSIARAAPGAFARIAEDDCPFVSIISKEPAGTAELSPFARRHQGVRDSLRVVCQLAGDDDGENLAANRGYAAPTDIGPWLGR